MITKDKYIWIIGSLVVVVALFFIFLIPNSNANLILGDFEGDIAIHKSSSCGCCDIYAGYFKKQGNSKTQIITTEDMSSIKTKYNIPGDLTSCHTTLVGDYFVEGHIPLEAIDKLIREQPDIAGIAMPGMPSGSPGMLGAKTEDFVIYAVDHNGGSTEFMRI